MAVKDESGLPGSRFTVGSDVVAETLFFIILILMAAGPLSGLIFWANTTLSSMFTRGAIQVESTRNLAQELMDTSDKIRALEKKLADSELELTKLRQEAKDVNKLRALLTLKQSLERRTIGADVAGRGPDNWYEQVSVDKGSEAFVQTGSAVITNQGIVGQVIKVNKSTSIVRLITDPEQKIGVIINRINQPGVLRGNNKNPLLIEYVPVGSPVEVGDKVTCLGNGGIFPAGHQVGTVSMVRRDLNGTTLSIQVRASEDLFDLTHVLIVPPINN